MAETPNVLISMPTQPFTMARSFKACANGKIYIGKVDTDPMIPANQIQVYIEREDGTYVPVPQPININAGGFPVYLGQIAKFVTTQAHSMTVNDAYGAQQFYYQNVVKSDITGEDGLKYIGQCPYVSKLRTIAGVSGQKIWLAAYHSDNWAGHSSPAGGGILYWVDDSVREDDSGVFFRVSSSGGWMRHASEKIHAEWFGVESSARDVGINVKNALAYISKNGGDLIFPSGEIKTGVERFRVDWFQGVQSFKLIGCNSVIVPDNLDPDPVIEAGKFYQSEKSIFVFTADSVKYVDGYLPPIHVIGLQIDYRNQRNKGGPTFSTMGESCHPTPFSDGMYGIYISRCLRPVIKDCIFRNIYGDGLILKRCADIEVRNNNFYDVSANQILQSDGDTAKDHRGAGIFVWGSTGVVDNNFVHNTRKYTVDVLVDGVNVNGALCGYIGIFAEYTMNAPWDNGTPSYYSAPMYPWYQGSVSSTFSPVNPDSMVVMTNNRVYGYTIGMKSEASADVVMIGNRIFNCYIGIDSITSSTTIENNWVDQMVTTTMPQAGFRFYQAALVLSDFGDTNAAGLIPVVRNNRIFTSGSIAALGMYRSDSVIESNQIRISGTGAIWKQIATKPLKSIKIHNNIFRVMRDSYNVSVVSRLSNFFQLSLKGNRILNETSFSCGLIFEGYVTSTTVFDDNHFDGMGYIQVGSKAHLSKNRFSESFRVILEGYAVDYGVSTVEGNHFECLTSMNNPRISFSRGDVRIKNNIFNLTYDSVRTIIGLIQATNTSNNVEVSFNRIIESGATQNFALLNANTIHNLVFDHNYGSGGRGYYLASAPYGPFQVEGNIGFGNGIMTGSNVDPNKEENLSPLFAPSIGSKVPYLRPVSGGPEGIVYTAAGWKTFGAIN